MDEQQFIDAMFIITSSHKASGASSIELPMLITDNMTSFPFLQDALEVKDSSIHGKGVFAKKDIEANQVVCFYPSHGVIDGQQCYSTDENSGSHEQYLFSPLDYKMKLTRKSNEFVFGNPFIQIDGSLGHLINDSYPNVLELKTLDFKILLKYMLHSVKSDNCAFVLCEDFVYVKSIQPIQQGDELLANYGHHYWSPEMNMTLFNALLCEHFSNCSKARQQFVLKLIAQLCHFAPEPSEKVKRLLIK